MLAYREYGRRWLQKHPDPLDMWNTFEDVSGQELDWFWRTWFYETWTVDLAVGEVVTEGDSTTITIVDNSLAPMPVPLLVTRADGSEELLTLPVEPWLEGAREQSVTVAGEVTKVVIDPNGSYTDVARANNTWEKAGG
jgi:aminopeptidase N